MPREFPRSRRMEEAIQRILSQALSGKARDPRLEGVIITDVTVSRDLSVAKVYYAVLSGEPANPDLATALSVRDRFSPVVAGAGIARAGRFLNCAFSRMRRWSEAGRWRI